ncbi:MAG: Fic family protein [Acidobacteriota bacterium]
MRSSGSYVPVSTTGARARAFVPAPLPPRPPLAIDSPLRLQLDRSLLALGRLDSIATLLPNPDLFLYSYVRKEAVVSSQIEGTQSSLSDLLLFEIAAAPGVPFDDVVAVSNYVAALEHGLARIKEGFPLSNRLIREMHEVLMRRGRGSEKEPGEFRRIQNWLGGATPADAIFVPPPADRVPDCMDALERFLHDEPDSTPAVIKAALAHVQFETIHPFLDGNGRLGRLLVPLILHVDGVLERPLLYLSLYFKQRREEYYARLGRVRTEGDWEGWLMFFAAGVIEVAENAVATAKRLADLIQRDRERVRGVGRGAPTALQVHEALQREPVTTIPRLVERTRLSVPGATAALERLVALDMVREVTGRQRNRVYSYVSYVSLFSEGTEPPRR